MKLARRSEFSRNVLVLASGTTVAQAIPIALTPILTRLYGPEDFGVLALFTSIVFILSTIAAGRYELAIMLPDTDEEALNIAALAMVLSAGFCLLTAIPAILLNSQVSALLGREDIGVWLYLVPITSFLVSAFLVLNQLNTRLRNFGQIARASMLKSLAMVAVQISVGLVHNGPAGLVAGQVASSTASNGALARALTARQSREQVSATAMKRAASRYQRFPLLSLPSALANVLSLHAVTILMSLIYSIASVGHYALVQRLLGMPSVLVGTAIGQVFQEQAAREYREHGHAMDTLRSTTKKLTLISFSAFGTVALLAPTLFATIFGEAWRDAGTYVRLLTPLFALRFIVGAVSTITSIFERQDIALIWQFTLLTLSIGTLGASAVLDLPFGTFLTLYSGILACHYTILYVIVFRIAKGGGCQSVE